MKEIAWLVSLKVGINGGAAGAKKTSLTDRGLRVIEAPCSSSITPET